MTIKKKLSVIQEEGYYLLSVNGTHILTRLSVSQMFCGIFLKYGQITIVKKIGFWRVKKVNQICIEE